MGTFTKQAREQQQIAVTTHGKSYTKEYNAWRAMIKRTTLPSNPSFAHYSKKGITVCERWLHSFENFLADMGDSPSSLHTVDRIKNHLGYSPLNCRWATSGQQGSNKDNNRVITVNGRTMTASQWSRELGIGYSGIIHRLNAGLTGEAAITPIRKK